MPVRPFVWANVGPATTAHLVRVDALGHETARTVCVRFITGGCVEADGSRIPCKDCRRLKRTDRIEVRDGCTVCGCTDNAACPGKCVWIHVDGPRMCSSCE